MSIPKIIHQIWIGPKPPPTKFMDTWKNKHESEGFEYIRWTEQEMNKRGFHSQLTDKIKDMNEINGKADILRWELLYEYGGFFVDADAYCIEPVTYLVEKYKAFVGYENEQVRGAGWIGNNTEYDDVLARTHPLIATGTMAFPPKHDLPRLAIEWIKNNDVNVNRTGKRAWRTVGPGLLTRLYHGQKWNDITVLPSYLFLPIHASGCSYNGREKIYANQEWGSTKNSYGTMNEMELPEHLRQPKDKVSILISSLDTKAIYIKDCLNSIKNQEGHIFFEIIWINDGSNEINTKILKQMLHEFENTTRFVKVVYDENDGNKGIGYTLNKGIEMCRNEIIIKMDSDDIMVPTRIQIQLDYMKKNPGVAICGGQVAMFRNIKEQVHDITKHTDISWEQYKNIKSHWFINHPTVCYRKSKVLEAGNYDKNLKQMAEDFELELRMLKTHGFIKNLPNVLLWYRCHDEQVTCGAKTKDKGGASSQYWNNLRNNIINKLIEN